MKKIRKTNAPAELIQWIDANKGLNFNYPALIGAPAKEAGGKKPHAALKNQLLDEQGFLCAYTGRLISHATSHVEHLKPQSKCAAGEDVEYRNVVACFPADGGDTSYGYGAPVKSDWWEEDKFVSPLTDDCERRFSFAWSGRVSAQPHDHEAAEETIKVLGLNSKSLCQLRLSQIKGFFGYGLHSQAKPLSKNDARQIMATIDARNGQGHLLEFCFVLKQLLPKYIAGA